MKNKIQKENNTLGLPNYEPLRDEFSKILENQRISKKKQALFFVQNYFFKYQFDFRHKL